MHSEGHIVLFIFCSENFIFIVQLWSCLRFIKFTCTTCYEFFACDGMCPCVRGLYPFILQICFFLVRNTSSYFYLNLVCWQSAMVLCVYFIDVCVYGSGVKFVFLLTLVSYNSSLFLSVMYLGYNVELKKVCRLSNYIKCCWKWKNSREN